MPGTKDFIAIATPLIKEAAARLAHVLNMRSCDREDVQQELWLHLLLWGRSDSTDGWNDEPLIRYAEAASRVRRLADLFARSPTFHQRLGLPVERPSSHRLDEGLAASRSRDPQRHTEMRLDVAVVMVRLPAELRATCEQHLSREAFPPSATTTPEPEPFMEQAVVTLRRVFQAHDLHEYL